jgi:hypothetical protein
MADCSDYILAMATHHRAVQRLPIVERRGLVFSPEIQGS